MSNHLAHEVDKMTSLNWRIIHTHDVEENWNKCDTFIPKAGEVIVYDIDATHAYERFKIGDGVKTIKDLPFTIENVIEKIFNIHNEMIYADGGRIATYEESVT